MTSQAWMVLWWTLVVAEATHMDSPRKSRLLEYRTDAKSALQSDLRLIWVWSFLFAIAGTSTFFAAVVTVNTAYVIIAVLLCLGGIVCGIIATAIEQPRSHGVFGIIWNGLTLIVIVVVATERYLLL